MHTTNNNFDFLFPKNIFYPLMIITSIINVCLAGSCQTHTTTSIRKKQHILPRRVCLTFRIMTNIVFITIISVNGVIFFFHTFIWGIARVSYDECHHLYVCLDYYYDYFTARWMSEIYVKEWTKIIITLLNIIGFPSANDL